MARKAKLEKSKEEPKFSTRDNNRCGNCGRVRAYMRDFGLCRLCFRDLAHKGQIPGVRKASW
jgi:small subunit ribosomal protein S14